MHREGSKNYAPNYVLFFQSLFLTAEKLSYKYIHSQHYIHSRYKLKKNFIYNYYYWYSKCDKTFLGTFYTYVHGSKNKHPEQIWKQGGELTQIYSLYILFYYFWRTLQFIQKWEKTQKEQKKRQKGNT